MPGFKTSTRLALSAGLITMTVIWLAAGLNLLPDESQAKLSGRLELVQAVAANASTLVQLDREAELREALANVCAHSRDMISCGFRGTDGRLVVDIGG